MNDKAAPTFPPLYKKDSKGKVRVWNIAIDSTQAQAHTYTITYGLLDGKQQSKTTRCKGKNIGRANETTPAEQVIVEAEAAYRKQMERQCYTLHPDDPPPFIQPQLALDATKVFKRLAESLLASPKLDGARTIYVPTSPSSTKSDDQAKSKTPTDPSPWQSRKGTFYNFPKRINVPAEATSSHPLDGELYLHGKDLNQILSAVKKTNELTPDIEFHVFDVVIPGAPYHERLKYLQSESFQRLLEENPWVKVVKQVKTHKNKQVIDSIHDDFVREGYEGIMLRDPAAPYARDERNPSLMKYKKFEDQEFTIKDIVEDKEGSAVLILNNHLGGPEFRARPMGTDQFRRLLVAQKAKYIGQQATVKYQAITEYQVPQFPVCTAIGDEK